jgi:hypothetical protein
MTGAEHYTEGERVLKLAQDMLAQATEHTIDQACRSAAASAAIAQAHFAATQAHGALYLELMS